MMRQFELVERVKAYAPDADEDLLNRAYVFGIKAHGNQKRDSGDPYFSHPLEVAGILTDLKLDDAAIVTALLHDTIEDTDTTRDEVARAFGERVAAIVAEVTDDKTLAKAERKEAQVEHAAHISREAKLVKLADKICNLRDVVAHPPAGWSLERRREYFDWAKRVVDRLRGAHPGLEAVFDRAHGSRP